MCQECCPALHPPRTLAWEEAADPGYPPVELVITHEDGRVERVWVE